MSGGGGRGVGEAFQLSEIERKTGRPIFSMFDLISGTSTGSILAAMAASPDVPSAQRMLEFYYERGPRIFKKKMFNFGLVGAKYKSEDLSREIAQCVGDAKMSSATTRLLIPTVDANKIDAVFVKSWDDYWSDFPIWAAATASSSAQTFFPAFSCEHRGDKMRFIDGGNHSNNPSASALFEAYRLFPGEEIMIVSLGAGRQTNPKSLPDGGIARWAPLVFGTVSECQDDCANYFCRNAPGVHSFTFDFQMDRFPAMDDMSKQTLDDIVYHAKHGLYREGAKFEQACSLLQS